MNAVNFFTAFALSVLVMARCQANYFAGLRWALVAIVACPENISLDFGIVLPSFTIQRIMIMIVTLFWLKQREIRVPAFRDILFARPQVFIAVTFLVAAFLAPNFMVSIKRYAYFIIESLVLFLVIQTSIRDERDAEDILWSVGVGIAIAAGFGFVERYTGFRVTSLFPSTRDSYSFEFESSSYSTVRDIVSVYKHRILFGTACALGSMLFLIAAIGAADKKPRRMRLALSMACAGTLYLSYSRGPWVAYGGAIVLMLPLMWRKMARPLGWMAVWGVLILISHPGVVASLSETGKETADADNVKGSSFRWRFAVMNRALDEIENANVARQIFGFGGGSHVLADHAETATSTGKVLKMQSWDCEFAVNFYEMGIAGFAGLMVLYGSFFRRVGAEIKRTHGECPWALTAAFGLILVLFLQKLSVKIFTEQLVCIESIALGLASRLLQMPKAAEVPELEEELAAQRD